MAGELACRGRGVALDDRVTAWVALPPDGVDDELVHCQVLTSRASEERTPTSSGDARHAADALALSCGP